MTRRPDQAAIELVMRAAHQAWDQVAPGLRRRRILTDRTALGLTCLCMQVGQYFLLLDAARRWPRDRAIAVALEEARTAARELAAEFSLIRLDRVRVGALAPSGADRDLVRIFRRSAA